MTGSFPSDVTKQPAYWKDHSPGYAFPQAPVTTIPTGPAVPGVPDPGFIVWTPNAAPTVDINRNAFMGVKPNSIEPGVTYLIAATVSVATSASRFRVAVADTSTASGWAPADGADHTLTVSWTADDEHPLIGIEYGPNRPQAPGQMSGTSPSSASLSPRTRPLLRS